MLNSIQFYQVKRILPFGIIWFVLGALFLSIEQIAIGDMPKTDEFAISLEPDILTYALVGIFLIGCGFGAIHVLWLEKLFRNRPLSLKVFIEFVVYLGFLELMLLINYPVVASMEYDVALFDPAVWSRFKHFLWSKTHLSVLLQMSFSIFASLLYYEVSATIGQKVLYNFFTGKYHLPVQEDRVFMFADMKDSTTIAEQLGHQDYFRFLREYYESFSQAIIRHGGEVYQYVGDEIVISWPLSKGLKNNNCIECFFKMKHDLKRRGPTFEKRFEIRPDFNASLHYGVITTGEIGALKKDIFFTGDVLNTTARILSKTSDYHQDLLISEALSKKLNLDQRYRLKSFGSQDLKGKKMKVNILAVEKV